EEGKMVKGPSRYGLGSKAYTKKLEKAGFTVETSYVYSDQVPRGGWIGWSVSSGTRVAEFSTIYKLYSQGRDPAKVAAERAAQQRAAEARAQARAAARAEAQQKANAKKKKVEKKKVEKKKAAAKKKKKKKGGE
ncbi:MAG: hypothetical protein L0H26_10720, partial [Microlunatus sp.]|nr:hypothetical protein [Microlunatus sp.]